MYIMYMIYPSTMCTPNNILLLHKRILNTLNIRTMSVRHESLHNPRITHDLFALDTDCRSDIGRPSLTIM